MANQCPACRMPIARDQVACRTHWFKLPKPLRDQIWRLYRAEQGSVQHRDVVFQAIALLTPREPQQTKVPGIG